MQALYNNNNQQGGEQNNWELLRPNTIVYTTLIHGWARLGEPDRAEAILREQLQDFRNGNKTAQPDATTFNAVLHAWAKSSKQKHPDAPQRAQSILTLMQEWSATGLDCSPDEYSLTSVVICWAQHRGPEHAESMLTELETAMDYGGSINHIVPTIVAYNAVLHAYAKAGNAQGADQLLRRLLWDDDDNDNSNINISNDIMPDETTFNTVIAAWSKSNDDDDAPLQAETLLALMKDSEDIQPSVVTYASVMQCWATSKLEGAAGRAEALLRDMQNNNENENNNNNNGNGCFVRVQPNIICYNIVLNAWANATRKDIRAIGHVMTLLDEVLVESNNNNLKPSLGTFRAVLYAIAGSAVTNKSERVYALLELMERHGIQPNTSDQKMIRRLTKNSEKQRRFHPHQRR
jgi:pentatricopeptide repeat protein